MREEEKEQAHAFDQRRAREIEKERERDGGSQGGGERENGIFVIYLHANLVKTLYVSTRV